MIVQVSLEAREDLLQADQHYSAISIQLAERLLIEFTSIVNFIELFPKSGIPFRKNYRLFPMKKFPYTVICHIRKQSIEVVGVIHNDRHPKYRTRRIK